MTLPGNWKLREVLELFYYKGSNSAQVKSVVDGFNSYQNLKNSKMSHPFSKIFNQSQMFQNNGKNSPETKALNQMEICQENGYKIISYWDEAYPSLLREIHLPPVLLFVCGNLQERNALSISIVGKRDCTAYGMKTARDFGEFFAKNNILVTSGMARGIDSHAHSSAIDHGGITYAIIASGLDCISPGRPNKQAEKILESGGAIISEYTCGTKANNGYFLHRNRIISGISKATIVVESGMPGGSMRTAKFAFEQCRDVYAVPGNINSHASVGTNLLLKRNMATPLLSPEEVLNDLGIEGSSLGKKRKEEVIEHENKFEINEDELAILKILTRDPLQVDELAIKAETDINKLLTILLSLEFQNLAKSLPGGYYVKT